MKLLTSMIAAGLLATAAPATAATYVAFDQFVAAGGAVQTGDFAAGSFTGPIGGFTGAFTIFATNQPACGGNVSVLCVRNGESTVSKAVAGDYAAAGASNFYKAGFLNLHADTNVNTVFQFVAPEAGAYTFTGLYKAHDISPTGVDIAIYNGATLRSSDTFIGGSRSFDFDADLLAGQKVSFLLGAAGNYTYDSTGFALTVTRAETSVPGAVPEPATWAMMLAGFFGMGATLRRRRSLMA